MGARRGLTYRGLVAASRHAATSATAWHWSQVRAPVTSERPRARLSGDASFRQFGQTKVSLRRRQCCRRIESTAAVPQRQHYQK